MGWGMGEGDLSKFPRDVDAEPKAQASAPPVDFKKNFLKL